MSGGDGRQVLNREIPATAPVRPLVGAVLAEQHDEWAEGRRYFGLDVLGRARLTVIDNPNHNHNHNQEVTLELNALSA